MLVKIPKLGYHRDSEKEFGLGNHVHYASSNHWYSLESNGYKGIDRFSDYGIADNVQQILQYHKDFSLLVCALSSY